MDALNWLARKPDAYAAAWPWPYRSALVLAVDAPDMPTESTDRYAKLAEEMGGHATYYLMSEQAANGADYIKKLQARGHEIAYLGDRFETFAEQPASAQGRRLDAMAVELKSAGIEVASPAGFHAPMEGYDKVTERLLRERGFGHYIADPGASESRLPFISPGSNAAVPTVVLPRTQSGPEDALAAAEEAVGEPAAGTPPAVVLATMTAAAVAGLNNYVEEFDRAEKMGGLSVVRVPSQTVLTDPQWEQVSRRAKLNRAATWTATGGQVANWWRDRERVRVTLDTNVTPPLLTVELSGESPLIQPLSVLVNLPQAGGGVRLIAEATRTAAPKVASFDTWRAALVFENLAPGTHRWFLDFDRAGATRY
jgi:peptidoglycan/xylan/chitin deacetylase (PgdA/CDA1 family)